MRILIILSIVFFISCDKNYSYLYQANEELGDSLFTHFPELSIFDSYTVGLKYKENLNIKSYCGMQLLVDVSSKEMEDFLNDKMNIVLLDSLRFKCGKVNGSLYIDQVIWDFHLFGWKVEENSYKYSLLDTGSYQDSLKFLKGVTWSETDLKILYWVIIK